LFGEPVFGRDTGADRPVTGHDQRFELIGDLRGERRGPAWTRQHADLQMLGIWMVGHFPSVVMPVPSGRAGAAPARLVMNPSAPPRPRNRDGTGRQPKNFCSSAASASGCSSAM